jgi:hypothetical protein
MVLSRAFMQLRPIVAALSRHKVATLLIVLQVALTLAVASNALFIVAMRIIHFSRPTSTDEAHIFVIRNAWKLGQTAGQIDANIHTDLETLRHVAGVRDAFSSQTYPLAGYSTNVVLRPAQTGPKGEPAKRHVLCFGRAHGRYTGPVARRRAQFSPGRNRRHRARRQAVASRHHHHPQSCQQAVSRWFGAGKSDLLA